MIPWTAFDIRQTAISDDTSDDHQFAIVSVLRDTSNQLSFCLAQFNKLT